jgi:hypothetical protein
MLLSPALSSSHLPQPVGRRKAARLRLSIPVRLITVWETQAGVLLDISCTGARIGLHRPLAIGAGGYLRIDTIEAFAEVVRRAEGSGGGINGLAFDEPLPLETVLAIRRHAEGFERTQRAALREQVRKWVTGAS